MHPSMSTSTIATQDANVKHVNIAGIRMVVPVRTDVTEFIRMAIAVPSVRPKSDQTESSVRFG
jgi:hypothetical protein